MATKTNNILLLGAGMVSAPFVEYFARKKGVTVTVATRSADNGRRLVRIGPNVDLVIADVATEAGLSVIQKLIGKADLCVSLLPYIYHVTIAKMCIQKRTNMLTSSYLSPELQALDEAAKSAGIIIMNECGLDPGIDHLLAMECIDSIHAAGGKEIPLAGMVSNAEDCLLPKEAGNECGRQISATNGSSAAAEGGMKWYFDPASLRCLAFGYKGCGGNANRFDTIMDCHGHCSLTGVYGHCAGGEKATARKLNGEHFVCSGQSNNNGQEEEEEKKAGDGRTLECPAGYKCQMMMNHGICCHIATYETYMRNYHPKCGNGGQPLSVFDEVNGQMVEVLAKQCDDAFCPTGMACHQQEIFAHCCPKGANRGGGDGH